MTNARAGQSDATGEATRDALFGGKITIHQPDSGYRTNVDALLLAAFASARLSTDKTKRPSRRGSIDLAVDLGAGCGAVAMALLHWGAAARVALVEIDREAATLAEDNLEANGWADRGDVICSDVEALVEGMDADLVVCNPPYFREGHGRPPLQEARARARQGDLSTFARAARRVCGRRARACFAYPAPDLGHLFDVLRAAGLEPKRLRAVHASTSLPARIVLVEAVPAKAGGLSIEAPLIEREAEGYTGELRELLEV